MTETQKKELKKIQKAVVATVKKMRTKIQKEQKLLKKDDLDFAVDIDPVENYDPYNQYKGKVNKGELQWKTKTFDVYYDIVMFSRAKHTPKGKTHNYSLEEKLSKLNLTELKAWLKTEFEDATAQDRKIVQVIVMVSVFQRRKSKNEYGDKLLHYLELTITEYINAPWKYGDLKIQLKHMFYKWNSPTIIYNQRNMR
jgi:hypothetical protein